MELLESDSKYIIVYYTQLSKGIVEYIRACMMHPLLPLLLHKNHSFGNL